MQRSKIDSLLGFAVKAGKLIYGIDSVEVFGQKLYVIFICDSASERTKEKVLRIASAKNIPVILSEKELQYAVGRKNCKIVAVKDKQMAQAMLGYLGESYRIISSEVK